MDPDDDNLLTFTIIYLIFSISFFAISTWLFAKAWNKMNRYFTIFIIFLTYSPMIACLIYLLGYNLLSYPSRADAFGAAFYFFPFTVFFGTIIIGLSLLFFKKTPTNILSTSSIKAPVKGGRRV